MGLVILYNWLASEPEFAIRANGSDLNLSVPSRDRLTIEVDTGANSHSGENIDEIHVDVGH